MSDYMSLTTLASRLDTIAERLINTDNRIDGEDLRDAAQRLRSLSQQRDELSRMLRSILHVDWERGLDWDTKTIMQSYLRAALRMQEIARTALHEWPPVIVHLSDCPVNAPAFEPGPCNCGASTE